MTQEIIVLLLRNNQCKKSTSPSLIADMPNASVSFRSNSFHSFYFIEEKGRKHVMLPLNLLISYFLCVFEEKVKNVCY
jgi:hypothetical protein